MIEFDDKKKYYLACCDGAHGLKEIKKGTAKLIYGSPPYPNAERNYGVWRESDYIDTVSPFIDGAKYALSDDGFLVINVKANRSKQTPSKSSKRSLVVEKLAILLEDKWGFSCVDIEIWIKGNPVPTGLRVACQDAYEQILWFSNAPKWKINLDAIRRPYAEYSLDLYRDYEYKTRENGLTYVRKNKKIKPNPLGALPQNIIMCGVKHNKTMHQAVQPLILPEKYIKACTNIGDIVVDPWVGSGTTGEASISLGRRFIGFDIFPEYVEMSDKRLSILNTECKE